MLDHETRAAILRLRQEGHGTRTIAKAVGVSRDGVRAVLGQGQAEVPPRQSTVALEPHEEQIRELHRHCKGNLVRVHEELAARHGVETAYSTLSRFCRDRHIGKAKPKAAGQYHFDPGQEMQHDTSPHVVLIGGRLTRLHCASLVHCFSRRKFFQCYLRWNRFHARIFLTRALVWLGGASATCMLDNSTVILAGGTGRDARISAEMEAFSKHFGFRFIAHAVGDANRSGRVERPFHHIENNFYPGRTFADLADLNAQAADWCARVNRTFHKGCKAVPDDLFAIERPLLKPLPLHIPEPMEIHPRKVDVEGFVRLHTNRYSAPEESIGLDIDVHETETKVILVHRHQRLFEHEKLAAGLGRRVLAEAHRRRWARVQAPGPSKEELALRASGPSMATLCEALRTRHGGQALRAMRRLHRIWLDYPSEVVASAIERAVAHDLVDPDRIEALVLRSMRGEFFRLPPPTDEDPHG